MRRHLAEQAEAGYDLNVNLLGEAVLGEDEAQSRAAETLALLERDDVGYVSVKVSAIASQLDLWAFDHSLDRVCDRLRPLLRAAAASSPPVFVNLDMEGYEDLGLTVAAFRRLLVEPELLGLEAGPGAAGLPARRVRGAGRTGRVGRRAPRGRWRGREAAAGQGREPGGGEGARRGPRLGAGPLPDQARGRRELQALPGLAVHPGPDAVGPAGGRQPQPVRPGVGPPAGDLARGRRPGRRGDAAGHGARAGARGPRGRRRRAGCTPRSSRRRTSTSPSPTSSVAWRRARRTRTSCRCCTRWSRARRCSPSRSDASGTPWRRGGT